MMNAATLVHCTLFAGKGKKSESFQTFGLEAHRPPAMAGAD
jgi:hypothetical protein